jgi:L-alanine-DL-glutamate epimerase-like enolase superfamily enzyme
MPLRVLGTDLHVVNMHTRMPFRYGIVTVRAYAHLFVRAEVEIDGARHVGVSAENLALKWFTKDPTLSARDELAQMRRVVETACDVARASGTHRGVFDWWLHVYQGQSAWGGGWGIPLLLTHLGTSLVERAVIDAFCRAQATPFARVVRENRLGLRLGDMHRELDHVEPTKFLPEHPARSVIARHTVGMSDPLTDAEISPDDRIDDGLPQSLEACVRAYGLTHFKIKLSGKVGDDVEQLRRIASVLARVSPRYRYTLDANENFADVETFRAFWSRLREDASMRDFVSGLIVVEQPLHRDVSMSDHTAHQLRSWADRPPIIIDESDAEIGSAARALDRGYVGTSHKNCKGVIKSIANACLLEHRRRTDPAGTYVLTAEDLTTVGPVALQEDLAVVGTLGIEHVERNGHHYLRGLSMFPRAGVDPVVERHADLYRRLPDGTPAVRIENGRIAIGSVLDAPFGLAVPFDPTRFTPLKDWTFESLSDQ